MWSLSFEIPVPQTCDYTVNKLCLTGPRKDSNVPLWEAGLDECVISVSTFGAHSC